MCERKEMNVRKEKNVRKEQGTSKEWQGKECVYLNLTNRSMYNIQTVVWFIVKMYKMNMFYVMVKKELYYKQQQAF